MDIQPAGLSLDQALQCVQVGEADFDLGQEVQALRKGRKDLGAIASFVGTVRDWLPDEAADMRRTMWLEHHPTMTARSMAEWVVAAHGRFDVQRVKLIHRVGALVPGDQIVMVAVASAHRADAFAGCMYLMDALKAQVPLWKKECAGAEGRWVAARTADEQAWLRWRFQR